MPIIPKPRYFEATLFSDETGEEKVSGTFTEDEHQNLVDYMDYTDQLAQTPLLRDDNQGRVEISHNGEGPLQFDVTLPDWTQVIAFIHLLRPLILQSESTTFYKIASLIGKYTQNSSFVRHFLSEQREIFSGRRNQRLVQFRSNSELLNSEKVLQSYLNGFEYHRDKDKQAFINSLHGMLPLDFSKVIFVGLLLDKARAIFHLADLVAAITGKVKEVNLEIRRSNDGEGLIPS